jgi:uncharacterized membrane protein YkoI
MFWQGDLLTGELLRNHSGFLLESTERHKTITEKAAGGEVVRVEREDDKNGKWNYEVVVKTNGKKWGFEVDPNGNYVRKHDAKPSQAE